MKSNFEERPGARRRLARGFFLLCLFGVVSKGICADAPALTEPQVKALCVLNFAKYVDWPADAFTATNSPITIGCLGDGKTLDSLKTAAEGKIIGGRKVLIVSAVDEDAWRHCQVLFIGASEKKRQPDILKRLKTTPILTVGESDQFLQQGGAINLLKKDGKIRFDVDVDAVHGEHLQISSKLLALADNVQTKP